MVRIPAQPPVAGALLIAQMTAAGYSVHAYSDADGNYTVPGLPAGNYNIYVQPLDGDVNGYPLKPGNISTYIYCNTIYTDYPGEYLERWRFGGVKQKMRRHLQLVFRRRSSDICYRYCNQ